MSNVNELIQFNNKFRFQSPRPMRFQSPQLCINNVPVISYFNILFFKNKTFDFGYKYFNGPVFKISSGCNSDEKWLVYITLFWKSTRTELFILFKIT